MTDLPPPTAGAPSPRRRRTTFLILSVLAVAALGGGAWWWTTKQAPEAPVAAGDAAKKPPGAEAAKGAPPKGGGRFGDPNRVQPVAVAIARKGDVRVVQNALGTVTALRTVTVKPRVDGPLLSVHFTEGQNVKAGDVLALVDPATYQVALAQAEGTLARDQALLANARVDLDRYRMLLAQDSIARQQVDSQEALVRQYEGSVKVDQALVDNAKLQLSWTKVTAPATGRLGLRLVDPGNIVRASDATGLVVIAQQDPITVVFAIPQDNVPAVMTRLGAGEKLAVEAWDRDQKARIATGTLITADNQVDVTTGTVKMRAQFANADRKLFPNQFVNVRMVVDVREGAVVVPVAAIQRGNQGTVVYVVKEDSTVAARPVKVGPIEGESVAIDSGLAAGERVIIDGVDRLREGAKVEVTSGPGSRPGGGDPSKRGRGEGKGEGKGRPDGGKAEGGKAEGGKPGGQQAESPPAGAPPPGPPGR